MNKEQLIKELNTYSKDEIIEAIADTDSILANRIISKLVKQKQKDLLQTTPTLIKFLSLPKESQEEILKEAKELMKKVFDFIENELPKTVKNTPNT